MGDWRMLSAVAGEAGTGAGCTVAAAMEWAGPYRARHPFRGTYAGVPFAVAAGFTPQCSLCGGTLRGYWRQRVGQGDGAAFVTAYECQGCGGLTSVGDDGRLRPEVAISRNPRGRR